jgi:tetratricopeptide (TPR) repeat protein
MLKKIEYFYATRDFGKAIELGEAALKKTDNKELLGAIHYSLSSNYLEKGIDLYNKNKDDSYYLLSIEHAKKALEVYPDSWQAWGNIGTVYFNMRDWKQAVYYITEAEKYLDKNNPSYASIEFTRRLADGMLKQNQ